jgi:hypothetical protein
VALAGPWRRVRGAVVRTRPEASLRLAAILVW